MSAETAATLVLILPFYFLPTLIVIARKHHQAGAVAVLNLLLGWTIIGWIAALVWSLTAIRKHPL